MYRYINEQKIMIVWRDFKSFLKMIIIDIRGFLKDRFRDLFRDFFRDLFNKIKVIFSGNVQWSLCSHIFL